MANCLITGIATDQNGELTPGARLRLTPISATNTIMSSQARIVKADPITAVFSFSAVQGTTINFAGPILGYNTAGGVDLQIPNASTYEFRNLTSPAIAGLPFSDSFSIVKGSVDASKQLRFEIDGLTTATTRVATWPDKSGTVAMTSDLVGGGSQAANLVYAGPETGSAAAPTFRVLVAADIPGLSGYQPLNTKLTAIGGLANGAGWLHNDGAGVFVYSVPSKSDVGLGSVANSLQLVAANNLTDLSSAATARGSLGLGSLATQSGTFSGTSSGTNTGDNAVNTSAQAYADALVVGLLDDRGNYNASVNTFPASGGSGSAGAVLKGDLWTISVAGTLGGHPVTTGDVVRALADTPGQTDANWALTENNFGYVAENSANKVTAFSAPTDTQYPSAKLVSDQLALKQSSITFGTGVQTALGVNIGSAGSPVLSGGALGSPSSVGTLPAHTLGGAVAGGGNQINNVIIGASTPLAGSFTTLALSGVETINLNTAAAPTPATGTGLQLVGVDTTVGRIEVDTFGAAAFFSARRAGGTGATPTATPTTTQLGAFNWHGFDGTNWTGPQASISALTTQLFSASNQGTKVTISTTPNGSTTLGIVATFDQDKSTTLAGALAVSGVITQTSVSATAFESGPNGGTNPVLRIVNSTASQKDGISITGGATTAGTTITALSDGATSSIIFQARTGSAPVTRLTINSGSGPAVTVNGGLTTNSGFDIQSGQDIFVPAGREFYFSGRSTIASPANGNIRLANFAENDFGLLQLGGATSSYPALGRSTTRLTVALADGTAGGGINFSTAAVLSIASGTNQRAGNATLSSGTVTVSNTTVTANTIVLIARKTAGGTLGAGGYSYTISAGTSFTINSVDLAGVLSALDTSVITYTLIEVP